MKRVVRGSAHIATCRSLSARRGSRSRRRGVSMTGGIEGMTRRYQHHDDAASGGTARLPSYKMGRDPRFKRSEEHTSELKSIMRNSYAVLCLSKQKNTILKPTNECKISNINI